MKTTLIVSALAATALSKPLLNKKWVVYTTELDIVTATVTGASSGWSWGGWKHGSSATAAASTSAPVTSEAAAPTTTTEAPAPTTEAPAPTTPAYTPPASTAAPAATSSAPAAASSAAAAPDSYSQAILDQHNNHRSNSSAPALSWSTDMANIAAQIAASCVYAHNT